MTGKKMTIRMLADEFEKLKEEVQELRPLKQKVAELEDKLKKVYCDQHLDVDNEEDKSKKYWKCKRCETSVKSAKDLKKHIKNKHPAEINCTKCEETFPKYSDLEEHIKNIHLEKDKYKCDECGKSFVLKWRLKKHLTIHSDQDIKGCHYFNNQKTCPFETLGCMFAHKLMGECKFKKKCNNKLCSYQHETGSESSLQCQQCEENMESHDALIDHVETLHVIKENMNRDHLFPQKCPNCPKWIYCDDQNESHYDDFDEFGQCEYRKSNL